MKYRIIAVCTLVVTIFTAIVFSNIQLKEKRYHQHLEAKVRPEDIVTTDEFATHLPLIDIKTEEAIPPTHKYEKEEDGTVVRKRNYDFVKSSFQYIQNEDTENKRGDKPVFTTNAYIRTRGRSSRDFNKKGYWIEFQNEDFSDNRDIEIDGMVADSDWVLHGPYMDKTLIRNYMCYNIAGEMMDYSPNVRFCEVFINDKYEGLYVLTEKIKYNEDGRVNITKTDPKLSETSYIIKIDEPIDGKYRINGLLEEIGKIDVRGGNAMRIEYPNKTLTEKQYDYINKNLAKIEKTIYSKTIIDRKESYKRYIDVNSFVDYFILSEFTYNIDASSLSTYLYKDVRGKLKLVPWDYNNSFENYENTTGTLNNFFLKKKWWYKYLLKDTYFTNKIISRYYSLRKGVLSDEYLNKYIDDTIEYLGPAIDRNFERWPDSLEADLLNPKERNQHSHKEAVDYLKKAIKLRGEYLDKNIESLKQYSHKSFVQE